MGAPKGSQVVPTSSTSAYRARAHAFRTHVEPELEVLLRVARTLTGNHADAKDLWSRN